MASLVHDRFQAVPPSEPVYWVWDRLDLPSDLSELLGELTSRITYFGRAESFCHIRVRNELPGGLSTNCELQHVNSGTGNPVLAADPSAELNLDSLLAATDAKGITGMTSPPSATWFHADIPNRPRDASRVPARPQRHDDIHILQFAVGGRVYPTIENWTRVTSWFRGRVLKNLALGHGENLFHNLSAELRLKYSGISGKDEYGQPLTGHQHAYFILYPG